MMDIIQNVPGWILGVGLMWLLYAAGFGR